MITDVEPVAGRSKPSLSTSWERHHMGLHTQSSTAFPPATQASMLLQPNNSLALQPTAAEPQPTSSTTGLQLQPVSSSTGVQLAGSLASQPLQTDNRLSLQPVQFAASSIAGSQGLPSINSNMAVHANRVRALRQMVTFPQPSASQQDLISLTDEPMLGAPVQSSVGLQAAAVEASRASFAGMDLGPNAVVHDNPLSAAVDLSPTPILPRLHIPGSSGAMLEPASQVCALM